MQHCTPCRRYLCRVISPVARGAEARLSLGTFTLCKLLLPLQPALQHRPTGAQAARQVRGAAREQGVLPLGWGELEKGRGRARAGWVRWRQRGGSRGGGGGGAVGAAGGGAGGHGAGWVGWREVLPAAVGHGGQRRERGRGGSRGAPAPNCQGDPLGGDGVDFGGDRAARGAGEGQRGSGQAVAVELFWRGGDGVKEEGEKKEDKSEMAGEETEKWIISLIWDNVKTMLTKSSVHQVRAPQPWGAATMISSGVQLWLLMKNIYKY